MKNFTLLCSFLLIGAACFAQGPYKLETLWKYEVNDSSSNNRYVQSGDYYMLDDSSVVFLTRVYYSKPDSSTRANEFYFSKLNSAGEIVINRKKLLLPPGKFYVKNFDVQYDGTLIVLAIKDKPGTAEEKTDSAILIALNNELNMSWHKFISSQSNRSLAPSRVTGVTALSDGTTVVGYNKRDKPRQSGEAVKALSLFTCFNHSGDSLFTRLNNDPIISISKGSNHTFFVQYDIDGPGGNVALHSSFNGSNLREVTNLFSTAAVQLSNFALKPSSQEFNVATISKKDGDNFSYNGPNTFTLNMGDSVLNFLGARNYKNVWLFKGAEMTITNDKDGGLYVFQYLKAGSDSQNTAGYLALCRLDSTGKDAWWVFSNDPINYAGGTPSKILPLKGDQFIAVVYTANGARLSGVTVNTKKQPKRPVTRMGVSETESYVPLTSEFIPGFSIKTANNPSMNSFLITVASKSNDKIAVRIIDMQGRPVGTIQNVNSNLPVTVGNNLKPGMYLLEAVQGNQRAITRLVKL